MCKAIAICATLLVFACSTERDELESSLIGTWHASYSATKDGDKFITHGEKTYYADGTSTGFISTRKQINDTFQEVERLEHSSDWQIDGNILILSNFVYSPSGTEPAILRDRIIKISATEAEFESSDGTRFKRYRKPPND